MHKLTVSCVMYPSSVCVCVCVCVWAYTLILQQIKPDLPTELTKIQSMHVYIIIVKYSCIIYILQNCYGYMYKEI